MNIPMRKYKTKLNGETLYIPHKSQGHERQNKDLFQIKGDLTAS